MSFELALQNTLFQTLSADPGVLALGASVWDDVPENYAGFPYITIGEAAFAEWDTDTSTGCIGTATIHTWSRKNGRKETKQIQGAIYDALHRAELAVTGFDCVSCDFIGSESFLDEDGKTRHGVQQFKFLITT